MPPYPANSAAMDVEPFIIRIAPTPKPFNGDKTINAGA
jgi:hypothetical protein